MLVVASCMLLAFGDEDQRLVKPWRSESRCGHNALIAFLGLHGVQFQLDEVDALLPDRPEGCSIEELRAAATRLGLPAKSLKFDPADPKWASGIDLPAIVHLDARDGHFVVLTRVEETFVEYVELAQLVVRRMPVRAFLAGASGYVVAAQSLRDRFAIPGIGGMILGIALSRVLRRRPGS